MPAETRLKQITEAALLAAGRPLSLEQLQALFEPGQEPLKQELREVLEELTEDYAGRGIEIREVGSGFRIQVRTEYASWVSRLFTERPPRYSRALLETLALIAYRQPITRGEIEAIRGVSVNTQIIKTLSEREWIRVVGHRDVPGRPALYATTREFLDYFNLRSLDELPTLAEIRDLEIINRELDLNDPEMTAPGGAQQMPRIEESDPDGETDSMHDEPLNSEDEEEEGQESPEEKSESADLDPDGETDSTDPDR